MTYFSNSTETPDWSDPSTTFSTKNRSKNLRKAAVVVETRKIPRLVHVIRNHMKHLGDDWDFYIVCSQETYDSYYAKILPRLKHIPGLLEKDTLTLFEYSLLLTSTQFWYTIESICDKCLIFQYDTWMVHGDIEQFFDYDYLGAPWWNGWSGGNGGFSLRTPTVMRQITEMFNINTHYKSMIEYHTTIANNVSGYVFLEDAHYFANLVPWAGTLAPRDVNFRFSAEYVYEQPTMALHKIHLIEKSEWVLGVLKSEKNTSDFEFAYNDFFEGEINNLGVSSLDIHEHLPILREYASKCDHITEFGVRHFVSTYALAMGNPKKLVSYDIERLEENYQEFKRLLDGSRIKIDFDYKIVDVLQTEIEETDFLFIDTEHSYPQLKNELRMHAKKVRKYIGFHDTVSFGHIDSNYFAKSPFIENYEGNEEKQGLIPAINEFLLENPEWQIDLKLENCNGLMILKKNS